MATRVRRILFPTDLSDLSFEAWPLAVELAQKFGAELRAAVVLEEPYALAPYEQYGVLLQALDEARPAIERRLLAKTRHRPRGMKFEAEVLDGASPTRALLDHVKRAGIDLIVMATHGRSGIGHLLIGSVAEKLVRLSPVPVLVVRPSRKAKRR
jgi:nucleotide-binding universal stress UspA family protein